MTCQSRARSIRQTGSCFSCILPRTIPFNSREECDDCKPASKQASKPTIFLVHLPRRLKVERASKQVSKKPPAAEKRSLSPTSLSFKILPDSILRQKNPLLLFSCARLPVLLARPLAHMSLLQLSVSKTSCGLSLEEPASSTSSFDCFQSTKSSPLFFFFFFFSGNAPLTNEEAERPSFHLTLGCISFSGESRN